MSARGGSLIEALIALAVVSFGSLSAAALQLTMKHTHAGAQQRALAARLAYEMAEQLRATPVPARYLTLGAPLGRGSRGAAEPQPDCSDAAPCDDAQLAAHELWRWEQSLDGAAERIAGLATGGLVSAVACIEGPAGDDDGEYRIVLAWRESVALPDAGAGPACGRDPQPNGDVLFSRSGYDNAWRRTLSLPLQLAAPRRPG